MILKIEFIQNNSSLTTGKMRMSQFTYNKWREAINIYAQMSIASYFFSYFYMNGKILKQNRPDDDVGDTREICRQFTLEVSRTAGSEVHV